MILPKGAPTLWIKIQKRLAPSYKSLAAFAFRSGTDNVSLAISSIHRNRHWEGVALQPAEALQYRRGQSLKNKAIKRVFGENEESDENGKHDERESNAENAEHDEN